MDHRSGGDLDEETVAWKRSRRVSFAETTAVHVFDRDEDFDTPPTDSKPSPDSLGFRGDHSDTDDSKGSREDGDEAVDEEEDEEEEEEERFVRDMDSSPGSAVGSVTSNDDDNFFGPVSTSFIKSGRLSDSGMSDDNNHDITLDSTAFSLHFRNIALPEDCSANSSRSLRSPTEYLVPTDSPGFVVPKGFIQQVPLSRLSDGKMSDTAGNSTNMSIIVENPDRYDDYGKMSPTLEALLTEANKRTHHDSPSNAVGSLTSKVCDDEVAVAKESGKDDTTTSSRRATGNAADDTSATTSTIHTPVSGRCSTGIEGKLICDGIPSPSKAETPPIDASSNKKTQLCSVDSLQSPNNNTNSNISMVQSSDLVEMVQTELSKDPMLYGHDFSYHGQQYVSELHSVEDEIPGKKRSIEQIFLTDKDDISEKSRSQKNPKVSSNVMGGNSGIFVVGHFHSSNESESIGGEEPRRHWRDMISRVSNNMRRLFSPAIFKLSLQELDILEDALSALQNGRKYDRISASLRNHDFSSVQKREAEASALLDKLAYEKAMVQLKRIRLDHLSSKMHLRKSRIQECDELKAICSRLCFLGARTVQESQIHSLTSNHSRINQEEDVRVTSMRQELEVIGQKVKLLVKSFESYCKIKGNMNCDGIINAVNVHLETTNCCRVIQQDLQLWKISDVVKKKDCCSIILNYRDLLTKRYTINNSVSNMVANNLLIDASIEKNFPNMNACTPFQFVLNDKDVGIVGKVASLKHLQHDTMETNLLLGVLLDVLEEILVSRMELWNLISSAFHLCCSGQLELRLCFLSFKSGRKVSLSLDLSSLNCGVYPSEPSDLRFQISNELPSSISDEIQRTIRNLPNGRPMIFRLCQSISQVVKVSI